jgi:uncharacterized iron-regulated membrane protein
VWTWIQFKNVLWFRSGLASKARDFNWHNVIGFWCCVPLAIIVAGVVPISFTWASTLVYRLAGDTPPVAAAGPRQARPSTPATQVYFTSGLDASWSEAIAAVPAWRTITTRLAASENAPIVITVDEGYAGQPHKRRTLTFDRATTAVAKVDAFEHLSAGRRARSWLRFAHTGEFYGMTGQTIAGLASLGGAFLVYTGLSLALRRLVAWLKRRRAAQDFEQPRAA